jgi:ribose/xylose/arabinose/galactoside ABC-type transport system permease subunit/ABC-type branched-subunit amino acid transport system ATPase component
LRGTTQKPPRSLFLQPGDAGNRTGLLIIAILLAVGFTLAYRSFGTLANANTIALVSSALGIAALGTACLLITGNIDLSIGGMYSLVGVVVAKVAVLSGSGALAAIVGLALGLALGLANGLLVRLLAISPIIVTVATMIIFGGFAFFVTNGDTIGNLPADFIAFGRGNIGPIRTPVVVTLVLFLAVAYVLTRTRLGLRLYAIGGNRQAAQLSGIPTDRMILGTFAFNGLMVAIGAVLTTSRIGIGSPIAGSGFEFGVLTAVILGGVAFNGGSGRPLGVLYGIAAIGILNAGLVFLGLPFYFQDTSRGALLLLALGADQLIQRKRAADSLKAALVKREGHASTRAIEKRRRHISRPELKTRQAVLSARGLSKRYGAVMALADADLDLRPGEVVCLLGDNGAGKSTLVKILSGAIAADSGALTIDGRAVTLHTPAHMRALGVETVYQDLALCQNLSVANNLTLGQEPTTRTFGFLPSRDDGRAVAIAAERLARLGVQLPSQEALVSGLSGGQRQAVAIARAVHADVKVVILDEPTAALGVHQTSAVLDLIRGIADQGVGVILISHDIQTVLGVADRIVVLRLGRVAIERDAAEIDEMELLRLMAGMPMLDQSPA